MIYLIIIPIISDDNIFNSMFNQSMLKIMTNSLPIYSRLAGTTHTLFSRELYMYCCGVNRIYFI